MWSWFLSSFPIIFHIYCAVKPTHNFRFSMLQIRLNIHGGCLHLANTWGLKDHFQVLHLDLCSGSNLKFYKTLERIMDCHQIHWTKKIKYSGICSVFWRQKVSIAIFKNIIFHLDVFKVVKRYNLVLRWKWYVTWSNVLRFSLKFLMEGTKVHTQMCCLHDQLLSN